MDHQQPMINPTKVQLLQNARNDSMKLENIAMNNDKENELIEDICGKNRQTELTAYFELNSSNVFAHQYTYQDIPKYYAWKVESKKCVERR